jgi:hypothetical protein
MTNIVKLDTGQHRGLCVHSAAAVRYGDNQRFVPVILGEFPHLAVHYPILLTKDSETGAFFIGAMLGFDEGENLFLDERGMETYRPLNLQRGPFFTAGSDLAIDLDNPRVGEGGQPLFTPAGEPTVYLQSIMALFRDLNRGLAHNRDFVARLAALKLLEPIDIALAFDDGDKRRLEGLYTINQEALRQLPDAEALAMLRNGYLQLAYLMVASLKQVPVLAQRRNRKLLHSAAPSGA